MPELGSYGSVRGAAGNSRPTANAGNDKTLHRLNWPASKKRQGTKSREVWHQRRDKNAPWDNFGWLRWRGGTS